MEVDPGSVAGTAVDRFLDEPLARGLNGETAVDRFLDEPSDASWYCTECYMLYYNCSYEAVCDMLGFSGRAGKKARYAKGKA